MKATKGKGQIDFLNLAFTYAGYDRLSHTLSPTVQSAQKRLAGVTLSAGEGGARSRNPEHSLAKDLTAYCDV